MSSNSSSFDQRQLMQESQQVDATAVTDPQAIHLPQALDSENVRAIARMSTS